MMLLVLAASFLAEPGAERRDPIVVDRDQRQSAEHGADIERPRRPVVVARRGLEQLHMFGFKARLVEVVERHRS
jgi:hypothetical protein